MRSMIIFVALVGFNSLFQVAQGVSLRHTSMTMHVSRVDKTSSDCIFLDQCPGSLGQPHKRLFVTFPGSLCFPGTSDVVAADPCDPKSNSVNNRGWWCKRGTSTLVLPSDTNWDDKVLKPTAPGGKHQGIGVLHWDKVYECAPCDTSSYPQLAGQWCRPNSDSTCKCDPCDPNNDQLKDRAWFCEPRTANVCISGSGRAVINMQQLKQSQDGNKIRLHIPWQSLASRIPTEEKRNWLAVLVLAVVAVTAEVLTDGVASVEIADLLIEDSGSDMVLEGALDDSSLDTGTDSGTNDGQEKSGGDRQNADTPNAGNENEGSSEDDGDSEASGDSSGESSDQRSSSESSRTGGQGGEGDGSGDDADAPNAGDGTEKNGEGDSSINGDSSSDPSGDSSGSSTSSSSGKDGQGGQGDGTGDNADTPNAGGESGDDNDDENPSHEDSAASPVMLDTAQTSFTFSDIFLGKADVRDFHWNLNGRAVRLFSTAGKEYTKSDKKLHQLHLGV